MYRLTRHCKNLLVSLNEASSVEDLREMYNQHAICVIEMTQTIKPWE